MLTMSTKAICGFLLLVCFRTGSLAADEQTGNHSQILLTATGTHLRLQISETTSLREVVTLVCQQQSLQCSGEASLQELAVPRMVIGGTLEEVLSELLAGTQMNYAFSRGSAGAVSSFEVLGRALGANDVDAVASMSPNASENQSVGPQPVLAPSASLALSEAMPEPESEEEANRTEAAIQQMFGDVTSKIAASTLSGNGGAAVSSSAAQSPSYLPFPDQFGNPLPTLRPVSGSPFPDRQGNPVRALTVVQGSPFPATPARRENSE